MGFIHGPWCWQLREGIPGNQLQKSKGNPTAGSSWLVLPAHVISTSSASGALLGNYPSSLGQNLEKFGSESRESGEQCCFCKGQLFGLCGIKNFSWRVLWVLAQCSKETQPKPSFMLQAPFPWSLTQISAIFMCVTFSVHTTGVFFISRLAAIPSYPTEETEEKKGMIHILNKTNFQV